MEVADKAEQRVTPNWKGFVARGVECLLGAILIYAAYTKSIDVPAFGKQIAAFGIITSFKVTLVLAWIFVALEYLLGAALITGFKRRFFLPATMGLFLVFSVALIWAWLMGSVEDCGCFGATVKRTPAEALIEDLALMSALVAAYLLDKRENTTLLMQRYIALMLLTLLGVGFAVYENSKAEKSADAGIRLQIKSKSLFQNLKIEDLPADIGELTKGVFLVALIDTGCDHCQAAVPELNSLSDEKNGLPKMVALCPNTAEEVEKFKADFKPEFPIGRISEKAFTRILENGDTPRVFVIKDGSVKKVWDAQIPDVKEIVAVAS